MNLQCIENLANVIALKTELQNATQAQYVDSFTQCTEFMEYQNKSVINLGGKNMIKICFIDALNKYATII